MMSKIKTLLKDFFNSKDFPIIFFAGWFLLFLFLAFFRNASLDENIYISDCVTISNLIQKGIWIGNSGVGLHGFLIKLLVGIIFIFTGPSVFVATLINILFGIFSGVLFYRILLKYFNFNKIYAILGVILLFSSYQFLMYIPTFYVDIISLFFLLLTLDSVLGRKSKWLTGLYLLLLLDAKEHVFYTVAPAFVIWIGIESYINNKGQWLTCTKEFALNGLKLFLPALVFLILMFTTSIIPLNIYNVNILGLIEGGSKSMAYNFEIDQATNNRDAEVNKDSVRAVPVVSISSDSSVIASIFSVINVGLLYFGKILYPRTFSILSIPLIIIIPSVVFAIKYFIEGVRKKEKEKILLPIMLVTFLIIYIIHASIGRYLIPISPIIFLFFIMFLIHLNSKDKKIWWILVLAAVLSLLELYFEYSYVWIKVIIYLILFSLFFLIYFRKRWNRDIFKYLLIILISVFCAGTSILVSFSLGQIRSYLLYGYDRECEKVISLIDSDDKIWINDINWDKLPFLLREENISEPEWNWSLKKWIPKKKLLWRNNEFKTYNFYWGNIDDFRDEVYKYGINKIVYVKLNKSLPGENLLLQDRLDILLNADWLYLESVTEMKNKYIYIFLVNNVT